MGGRCFTSRGNFAQGQIAEHGGELIDTDHHATRHLAHELGLKLTDVLAAEPPGTQALYLFNGQPYNLTDATADWQAVYDLVQHQSTKIGDFSFKGASNTAKRFGHRARAGRQLLLCRRAHCRAERLPEFGGADGQPARSPPRWSPDV